ncbi:hypothetical protein PENSPDRAFT_154941 [Peniophora sp. CONT]|nr:hypothetical protein PENSPDRAFT_154941 [Peniophora sp. CONT]
MLARSRQGIPDTVSSDVRCISSRGSLTDWRILQELLRGEDVVGGLAAGVELISAHGSVIASLPGHPPQHELARSILDVRGLLSAARDDVIGKPFAESIKSALRTEWWPSLNSLQKAAYRASSVSERGIYKEVMLEWMGLGHDVGLDGKERKRHEHEAAQRCSWAACMWHRTTPGESVKLKACQGCGQVRYCGRECQKSDWNKGGHRTKCRRLK